MMLKTSELIPGLRVWFWSEERLRPVTILDSTKSPYDLGGYCVAMQEAGHSGVSFERHAHADALWEVQA